LRTSGAGDLRGSFALRLDGPLEECLLAFADRVYLFDSIRPNEPVLLEGHRDYRSLRGYLTGQTAVLDPAADNRVVVRAQQYNRASYDAHLVMRMLMFHEKAGGRAYTGLNHHHLRFTDLSEQLDLGRAILVGSYRGRTSRLRCTAPGSAEPVLNRRSYVRLVLPVEGAGAQQGTVSENAEP
ncbi:MAG: hypothetical protein ACOC46_03275, partial [Pirellulales bacterium]